MRVIKLVGGRLDGRLVELAGDLPAVFEAHPGPDGHDVQNREVYVATGLPCPDSGLPAYRFTLDDIAPGRSVSGTPTPMSECER